MTARDARAKLLLCKLNLASCWTTLPEYVGDQGGPSCEVRKYLVIFYSLGRTLVFERELLWQFLKAYFSIISPKFGVRHDTPVKQTAKYNKCSRSERGERITAHQVVKMGQTQANLDNFVHTSPLIYHNSFAARSHNTPSTSGELAFSWEGKRVGIIARKMQDREFTF